MGKPGSVAPQERVNIVFRPAGSKDGEAVELPLKILMLGSYRPDPDATPLEERKTVNVDRENFKEVMSAHALGLNLTVRDALSETVGTPPGEHKVTLRFRSLEDFSPAQVARQVPALASLLELRAAVKTLAGFAENKADFRHKIERLLKRPEDRARLMKELGLSVDDSDDTKK